MKMTKATLSQTMETNLDLVQFFARMKGVGKSRGFVKSDAVFRGPKYFVVFPEDNNR